MGLGFCPLFLFICFPFISTKIKPQNLLERMENKHAEPVLLPTCNWQISPRFLLLRLLKTLWASHLKKISADSYGTAAALSPPCFLGTAVSSSLWPLTRGFHCALGLSDCRGPELETFMG